MLTLVLWFLVFLVFLASTALNPGASIFLLSFGLRGTQNRTIIPKEGCDRREETAEFLFSCSSVFRLSNPFLLVSVSSLRFFPSLCLYLFPFTTALHLRPAPKIRIQGLDFTRMRAKSRAVLTVFCFCAALIRVLVLVRWSGIKLQTQPKGAQALTFRDTLSLTGFSFFLWIIERRRPARAKW